MKIVQSYWSKPMLMNDNSDAIFRSNGGWVDKIYFYMSWALSCLKFKELYGDVELVTDKYGKSILYDILELPFSSVKTDMDVLNDYDHNLWALGKIFAYSIQQEPFIHVDYDVFVWKLFPQYILKSELIGQNLEEDYKCNVDYFNQIREYLDFIPDEMKQEINCTDSIIQVNAGILGGNNIDFFKDFTKSSFEMVNRNSNLFKKVPVNKTSFNMVYEQFLFYCMAKHKNVETNLLFKENYINHAGLADFHEIPVKKYYVHALGTYKKYTSISGYVAERLLFEYPEYYNRIITLVNKNYI